MTGAEKIRVLVEGQMQKAHDSLRAARVLFDEQLFQDSVSRSYYAMFHAASALLIPRGLGTSKHKGLLSLFSREFVKTGVFPKQMSDWIRKGFDARLVADYGEDPRGSRTVAETTLRNAEQFIAQIRPVLDRILDELEQPSDPS